MTGFLKTQAMLGNKSDQHIVILGMCQDGDFLMLFNAIMQILSARDRLGIRTTVTHAAVLHWSCLILFDAAYIAFTLRQALGRPDTLDRGPTKRSAKHLVTQKEAPVACGSRNPATDIVCTCSTAIFPVRYKAVPGRCMVVQWHVSGTHDSSRDLI